MRAEERDLMKKEIFEKILYALIYTFGEKKAEDIFDRLIFLMEK